VLAARAFRAVDLCFRGPLASCAPGRVPRRLRLPTASTRSGSGLPSGFAGSRRSRSFCGTTCSVGSGAVFRPVPLPSPAPEGAGWSGSRPEGHAPVPLSRSEDLQRSVDIQAPKSSAVRRPLAPKSSKVRRHPGSQELEDPKASTLRRARRPQDSKDPKNSQASKPLLRRRLAVTWLAPSDALGRSREALPRPKPRGSSSRSR